jgi:putative transposase
MGWHERWFSRLLNPSLPAPSVLAYTPAIMPSRLKRYQEAGDSHFLTFSCHGRLPYLGTAAARDLFLASFEEVRRHYVFHVFGYVVMPEHVHLLISEPKSGALARALQSLKTSVAKQMPQKPFWLARYYDFNLRTEEKHTEKLHYMHRNPVKRGLVNAPEDWLWSSYKHFQSGEVGLVEIESAWTAGRRMGLKIPGTMGERSEI